ncbi:MarR family transcriptional regulator [Allobaculum sp. Allo2]|uniref:MarR family transcriptional regulator n=1 Tax=Allobaculum sp. Allo2 TaxID=2853432 RepID=UPI001F6052A0|nr:MarR family transcriptional regulator [Allobaculum sp. Allo2]UNT94343.1 MarR family transcriptional regulator [Allobaculum sp. Allo2]
MNSEEMIKKLYGSAETQKMFIFCMLLITANRLQTLFDQSVPDLSLKQIILLAIVRYSKEPMTFTQLAKLLGCSRQNVKKLADVLVKKAMSRCSQTRKISAPSACIQPIRTARSTTATSQSARRSVKRCLKFLRTKKSKRSFICSIDSRTGSMKSRKKWKRKPIRKKTEPGKRLFQNQTLEIAGFFLHQKTGNLLPQEKGNRNPKAFP